MWQKWDFDDGFVLSKTLQMPYRQKRAGMPYGLSILVDPNIGYFTVLFPMQNNLLVFASTI